MMALIWRFQGHRMWRQVPIFYFFLSSYPDEASQKLVPLSQEGATAGKCQILLLLAYG